MSQLYRIFICVSLLCIGQIDASHSYKEHVKKLSPEELQKIKEDQAAAHERRNTSSGLSTSKAMTVDTKDSGFSIRPPAIMSADEMDEPDPECTFGFSFCSAHSAGSLHGSVITLSRSRIRTLNQTPSNNRSTSSCSPVVDQESPTYDDTQGLSPSVPDGNSPLSIEDWSPEQARKASQRYLLQQATSSSSTTGGSPIIDEYSPEDIRQMQMDMLQQAASDRVGATTPPGQSSPLPQGSIQSDDIDMESNIPTISHLERIMIPCPENRVVIENIKQQLDYKSRLNNFDPYHQSQINQINQTILTLIRQLKVTPQGTRQKAAYGIGSSIADVNYSALRKSTQGDQKTLVTPESLLVACCGINKDIVKDRKDLPVVDMHHIADVSGHIVRKKDTLGLEGVFLQGKHGQMSVVWKQKHGVNNNRKSAFYYNASEDYVQNLLKLVKHDSPVATLDKNRVLYRETTTGMIFERISDAEGTVVVTAYPIFSIEEHDLQENIIFIAHRRGNKKGDCLETIQLSSEAVENYVKISSKKATDDKHGKVVVDIGHIQPLCNALTAQDFKKKQQNLNNPTVENLHLELKDYCPVHVILSKAKYNEIMTPKDQEPSSVKSAPAGSQPLEKTAKKR